MRLAVIDYTRIIKIKAGKPFIRDTKISVSEVLSWLDSGMSIDDILEDFPELNENDIVAAKYYSKNPFLSIDER